MTTIKYQIAYRYTASPESEDGDWGWINGVVTLGDGRAFAAGGGWVDPAGVITAYGYRDAGSVDELGAALGLDREDTMDLLRSDCPEAWPA